MAKKYFPTDQIHNVFHSFNVPFSGGGFTGTPTDLHIPINQSDLGIDGKQRNGTVVTADFVPSIGKVGAGTSIFRNDLLTVGKSTSHKFLNAGNALSLDGVDDYASTTSFDELKPYGDDFAVSYIIKYPYTAIQSRGYIEGLSASWSRLDGTYIQVYLYDGSGVTLSFPASSILDLNYHYVFYLVDRSAGYVYLFIDGDYFSRQSFSLSGDITLGSYYVLGAHPGNFGDLIEGDIDEARRYRFGKDGFYITGTPGTDLIIRVGDSSGPLLWSDTDPESSLIRRMYRSPSSSLSDIGFGELENALRNGGNFLSDAGAESAFPNFGGDGSAQKRGTITRSTEQAHSGSYSVKYTGDGSSVGSHYFYFVDSGADFFEPNKSYYAEAWIYLPSGQTTTTVTVEVIEVGGTSHTIGTVTTTDSWTKVGKAINLSSSFTDIRYQFSNNNSDANTDYYYVDDLVVVGIGEIAHWKMNEEGTPATLVDSTVNGFDLTTSGSPVMVENNYIASRIYNFFNPHTGTVAFKIRPSWEGDDNIAHYIFSEKFDSNNYLNIYKDSSNNLQVYYVADSASINVSYDISAWAKGDEHYIGVVWSVNSIDGTDYIHLYIDGSEVASTTSSIGYPDDVGDIDIGSDDGSNQFEGIIGDILISEIPFKDTKANAFSIGLPVSCSIEWLYNSGNGNTPVVDEYTRCVHAGR